MKLNDEFVVHTTGDGVMLVPLGGGSFNGVVRGNKTLAVVLESLQKDTSIEQIVNALCERFDVQPDVASADVRRAIDTLREVGALDE